jgi:hypothetical protein
MTIRDLRAAKSRGVNPRHRDAAGHHVSLAASNSRPAAPDRRTGCLAQAYACGDMAMRADNADDRKKLRAMAAVWYVLAQRDAPARTAPRLVGDEAAR